MFADKPSHVVVWAEIITERGKFKNIKNNIRGRDELAGCDEFWLSSLVE